MPFHVQVLLIFGASPFTLQFIPHPLQWFPGDGKTYCTQLGRTVLVPQSERRHDLSLKEVESSQVISIIVLVIGW